MAKTGKDDPRQMLRYLPSIEELLSQMSRRANTIEPDARANLARRVVARLRSEIEEGTLRPGSKDEVLRRAVREADVTAAALLGQHPVPVINAAGVILHTNLGRAPLAQEALRAINAAAAGYSNLEYDLVRGERGSRLAHLEEMLCVMSGAPAALAVNNNAGAVLLALNTMADGKEVIVSRGHLVEIGGSFRMPAIMEKSGARLVEVGTTNKTHLKDFEQAITRRTGLILHVHQSNFVQKGFVKQVSVADLISIARKHGVPVMDDQGSGILRDPGLLGAPDEPTVLESLEAGASVVSFSGDKLLGGSQAGIVYGESEWIERMKANPLARALRLDKLQLTALEATIRLYLTGKADEEVPVRSMIQASSSELKKRAGALRDALRAAVKEDAADRKGAPALTVKLVEVSSVLGGGSSPEVELPDWGVALVPKEPGLTASGLERAMREGRPPVVARVSEEQVILTIRAVFPKQGEHLPDLIVRALKRVRTRH